MSDHLYKLHAVCLLRPRHKPKHLLYLA